MTEFQNKIMNPDFRKKIRIGLIGWGLVALLPMIHAIKSSEIIDYRAEKLADYNENCVRIYNLKSQLDNLELDKLRSEVNAKLFDSWHEVAQWQESLREMMINSRYYQQYSISQDSVIAQSNNQLAQIHFNLMFKDNNLTNDDADAVDQKRFVFSDYIDIINKAKSDPLNLCDISQVNVIGDTSGVKEFSIKYSGWFRNE